MIRYIVCGGYIRSKSDGEEHYVSPQRLVELYDVNPSDCLLLRNVDDARVKGFTMDYLTRLPWLTPKDDGDYGPH